MSDLAPFPGVDNFYEYRGMPGAFDAPPIWLPVQQGDVFLGVNVPGIDPPESDPPLAMVFMHPCVMRRGPVLAERITVFSVRQMTAKPKTYETYVGHYSGMPLPDLFATGKGVHMGQFQLVGTVPGTSLDRSHRVVSLSKEGRWLLQQRAIHHFTRHAVPVGDLRLCTLGVEREVELLTNWCEAASAEQGETAAVVAAAEVAFDAFLSEDDRRARLSDEEAVTTVTAEVQREIGQRYP